VQLPLEPSNSLRWCSPMAGLLRREMAVFEAVPVGAVG
jgi:hypothetical protein